MKAAAATVNPFVLLGRWMIEAFAHVGRLGLLVVEFGRGLREPRIWVPRAFAEAWNVGIGSLFIILLVSSFAGGVTALQTGYQFRNNLPYSVVGTLVVESIVLELGPVLTGLILAGRIGARYAAELGTMRVTEQIDALESLGRSPASHLLVPRVMAGLVMVPVLVVIADITGILAGWWGAKQALPALTNQDFVIGAQTYYRAFDGWYSVIKAFFFAIAITVIPCYMGFRAGSGAEGVGRATTGAVVSSSVTILLLDVLLAKMLLNP